MKCWYHLWSIFNLSSHFLEHGQAKGNESPEAEENVSLKFTPMFSLTGISMLTAMPAWNLAVFQHYISQVWKPER